MLLSVHSSTKTLSKYVNSSRLLMRLSELFSNSHSLYIFPLKMRDFFEKFFCSVFFVLISSLSEESLVLLTLRQIEINERKNKICDEWEAHF